MAEQAAFVLWPNGPLRFGDHPRDARRVSAFPRSDTLFGALCWARRARLGDAALRNWLDGYRNGDPPLLLSSGLPVLETEEGRQFLIPGPIRQPPGADRREARTTTAERKRFKGVRWIDPDLLALFKGGESESARRGPALLASTANARYQPRADDRHARRPERTRNSGPLWDEDAPRARVAIDRQTSAGNLFAVTSAWLPRGHGQRVGIGLLVEARDAGQVRDLEGDLDLLAEAGIGGDRSIGAGGFAWESVALPFGFGAAPRGLALSLVWPGNLATDDLARLLEVPPDRGYRLVERMGWIASPEWQGARGQSVAMLEEGSYVHAGGAAPVGGLAEVTPPGRPDGHHPVYRYGFGLFLDEGRA